MITETYLDKGKKHRWRIWSPNGRKVAVSGESFASASNAQRACDRFLIMVGKEVVKQLQQQAAEDAAMVIADGSEMEH